MTTLQRNMPTATYPDHPPPATLCGQPPVGLSLSTPDAASLASLARTAALLDRWRHAAHAGGQIVGWGCGASLVALWAAVGWGMVEVELGLAVVGWLGASVADWAAERGSRRLRGMKNDQSN
jgi:hypothetical protein